MPSEDVLCHMLADTAKDIRLVGILADALEDSGRTDLAPVVRYLGSVGNTKAFRNWAFFAENAGYARGKRLDGALALARAEEWARSEGIWAEWSHDFDGCLGCDCNTADCPCATREDHETLGCVLYRPGEGPEEDGHAASLWGICNPTTEYRRVVEAELALEVMPAEALAE